MFNYLKKAEANDKLKTITLKLSGLHCTSCAVNIDLALEDIPGVVSSKTNYQKSESTITFDPQTTKIEPIKKAITSLGYSVSTFKSLR